MGQIQVMSEALANQIAAGEVVERPSSCVKELVENSIDAGARNIRVAIEEGGISVIIVQDDGHGMDESDAVLAFSRHATSKLTQARDLFRIGTLGFRGEALASIAAVARVTLQTRTRETEAGVECTVAGSTGTEGPKPVGMPVGTRIEVRDLFFNTPARLKYLRTVATEQARCVEVVQRAALSRTDISFRCEVNGNIVFQTPGRGADLDVVANLFGPGEAKQFVKVVGDTADYSIHGYLGRPTQSKASRAFGHLFINQRPIRNLAVHQAVVAGYHGRLMINRHPIYALYIEMNPGLVDVNIHPHKAEVRFSEERDLCQLIQARVRAALDETFLVPTIQIPAGHSVSRESPPVKYQSALTLQTPIRPPVPHVEEEKAVPWGGKGTGVSIRHPAPLPSSTTVPREQLDATLKPPLAARTEGMSESETGIETHSLDETSVPRPLSWHLRPIGQTLGMYIIADDGENLYIIDQHAAHERVLYEKFNSRLQNREVHAMPLLTPLPLHLSPEQLVMLDKHAEELKDVGLEFEAFGGSDVLLRTVPDVWDGLDVPRLVEEFVEMMTGMSRVPNLQESVREQIVMRACKAAIKANHHMSDVEIEALCDAMSDLEDPFHCPHGRPVFIRLTNRDLEKEFRRIV
jgi:DNA mismatch repair protein MutL